MHPVLEKRNDLMWLAVYNVKALIGCIINIIMNCREQLVIAKFFPRSNVVHCDVYVHLEKQGAEEGTLRYPCGDRKRIFKTFSGLNSTSSISQETITPKLMPWICP